jgi:hypothetical protein
MWDQFSRLGSTEHYVIDSSELDPKDTTKLVQQRIAAGDLRFPAVDL